MKDKTLNSEAGQSVENRVATYPQMQVLEGDMTTFKRFRFLEPGLVSLLDSNPTALENHHKVLVLVYKNDPLGCISLVHLPRMDTLNRVFYNARLDLVIVANGFRGMGIGRSMMLMGMYYLLETLGDSLKSISAATPHPAADRVLQSLEFTLLPSQDGSLHRTLDLKGLDRPGLLHVIRDKTDESLKRMHYTLRRLVFKP
ncbi:hypothetical protein NITGR_290089 [Nitrospina gracilis 3/211]|uniref:N-acetyltransferase domain-containing protein n=1 Tax=Nitrospina gracilis (strain 3/211) TaxID=1266370 RepID=M1YYB3_NITG3|nr:MULTISPECIES: GNAT family N-acetyltransferase [Nitrospina]MCF8723428.1 hypothetical protein [Nitrospina sp. Nb-3]CCQ90489.1 hypothetical protein NITGR_290089 [Nitrospina gracilis 3/211]